jgi:hypothetical protein
MRREIVDTYYFVDTFVIPISAHISKKVKSTDQKVMLASSPRVSNPAGKRVRNWQWLC